MISYLDYLLQNGSYKRLYWPHRLFYFTKKKKYEQSYKNYLIVAAMATRENDGYQIYREYSLYRFLWGFKY